MTYRALSDFFEEVMYDSSSEGWKGVSYMEIGVGGRHKLEVPRMENTFDKFKGSQEAAVARV